MDLSYILILLLIMIVVTCALIHTLYESRNRIEANFTRKENKIFFKDLRLAVTSILFNVLYVILYLPIYVVNYFISQEQNLAYISVLYAYMLASAINFYVLLAKNPLVRRHFVWFICCLKPAPRKEITHRDQIYRVFFINQDNPRITFRY